MDTSVHGYVPSWMENRRQLIPRQVKQRAVQPIGKAILFRERNSSICISIWNINEILTQSDQVVFNGSRRYDHYDLKSSENE